MVFFDKIYGLTEMTAFLINLGLLVYAWGRRRTPGGRAAVAMMLASCIWLGTGVLGWFHDAPDVQFFWEKCGYLGVLTLPVAWFAFSMVLSGREAWLNRYRIGLLLVVPLFLFGLVMTGTFFKEVSYTLVEGLPVRHVEFSSWVWLSSGYSYSLIGIATILMVRAMVRSPYLFRYQAAILVLAAFFPIISNLLYLSHVVPMVYDTTPLTFGLAGFILTVGLFRYNLFDLVPIARGTMVDRVSDGMIVVDARGRVADLNQAAQHALGVRLVQAVGRPLQVVVPALAGMLAVSPARHTEMNLEKDGQLVYYEALATPLYKQRGILAGHLILLHDITARKQIEAGLQTALAQQRELNEMKSRFYLYFSHQLRTPLSVIMSSAEMLDHYSRGWPEDKRRRHFQRIYEAVGRLLSQSQQATTYEKAEQGLLELRPERFDPTVFARQLAEEIQHTDQDRHTILYEMHGTDLEACQDPSLLRQALENLLVNALKFSPGGSQVCFTLEINPQELCFTVKDQGCGIPAEELPRVTQPFFRASNVDSVPGSGLGLAIALQYVQRMGGTLRIESCEHEGTSAVVVVPLELAV